MKQLPTFSTLTDRQSRALLRRNHVGRIAFTFKDRVDIEPIGYVSSGNWLYGRTSPGTKLVQLRHNPWVAFEVDEVEGPFDWESVVAHGTVYFLNPEGEEHPEFRRGLSLLRRMDPRVSDVDDPAPHRTVFFRIHINDISGRKATTRGIRKATSRGIRKATTRGIRKATTRGIRKATTRGSRKGTARADASPAGRASEPRSAKTGSRQARQSRRSSRPR